jgi:hypothetical protein
MATAIPGFITDRNVCANQVSCNILNYQTLNPPVGGGGASPLADVLNEGNNTGGRYIVGAAAGMVLDHQLGNSPPVGLIGIDANNVNGDSMTIQASSTTGTAGTNAGALYLLAGNASSGSTANRAGSILMKSGTGPFPGNIRIEGGDCIVGGQGTGGTIDLIAGDGTSSGDSNGGSIRHVAGIGYGTGAIGGNVSLSPGINMQQSSTAYQMGSVGIDVSDVRYGGQGGAHFCARQDTAPSNTAAGSSDMSGVIQNLGPTSSAVVSFVRAYKSAPTVLLTASDPNSPSDLVKPLFASSITSFGFTANNPNSVTTVNVNYIVIGNVL